MKFEIVSPKKDIREIGRVLNIFIILQKGIEPLFSI